MSELTILYKDTDGDTFSLEIKQISELEKWITQHPSDIYYLKQEKNTYKILRVAKYPLATPKITATNEQMSELTFISGNEIADFLEQYKCCEYYLAIDQRVFVIKSVN